ncbi:MAG: ABC transporter ATP-binding protein [Kiritimatiellia bacterium]
MLKDISFDAAPGDITAIVGANGAGKTTLMRILSFVLMQDSGNISLDGVDPLSRPVRYRKRIGYLPEKCPVYEEMRVDEYLLYRLRLRGERNLRQRRRLNGALELCELKDAAGSLIKTLSQGYRKRVGLADALMQHPRLLLLDEPLAGLDQMQRKRIGSVLTSFSAHASIILAGHEINEMLEWCTRFIVLKHGELKTILRAAEYERAELKERLDVNIASDDGGDA